jgi:hypothetical protein
VLEDRRRECRSGQAGLFIRANNNSKILAEAAESEGIEFNSEQAFEIDPVFLLRSETHGGDHPTGHASVAVDGASTGRYEPLSCDDPVESPEPPRFDVDLLLYFQHDGMSTFQIRHKRTLFPALFENTTVPYRTGTSSLNSKLAKSGFDVSKRQTVIRILSRLLSQDYQTSLPAGWSACFAGRLDYGTDSVAQPLQALVAREYAAFPKLVIDATAVAHFNKQAASMTLGGILLPLYSTSCWCNTNSTAQGQIVSRPIRGSGHS